MANEPGVRRDQRPRRLPPQDERTARDPADGGAAHHQSPVGRATQVLLHDERSEDQVGRDREVGERVRDERHAHPRTRQHLAQPLARLGEEALRLRADNTERAHQREAREAGNEARSVDRVDERVADRRDEQPGEHGAEQLGRLAGEAQERVRLLERGPR